MSVRLLLADDHDLVRQGLKALLKWGIHRIEIIWQPAMLQGEERAVSVIRAPTSNTPNTEQR